MARRDDAKGKALKEQGCLNPWPSEVKDRLFIEKDFFDPRDLVQVKYEMLRRVRDEGWPVKSAAGTFGFSRVSFYQARASFEKSGLSGLLPRKRGPKKAHKLTEEVMDFIEQAQEQDPSLRSSALSRLLKDRLGLSVHPRSIERALFRQQKKL